MSTPFEPAASASSYDDRHGRNMSRRRKEAVERKQRRAFVPWFHGLDRRLMPTTFVVINTSDSGPGSLRQVILDSNAAGGQNSIHFSIGSGAQTILLLSPLPSVVIPVAIDGTSQPGYAGTPLINLDGTNAGGTATGLDLAAGSGGSQIIGLVINNFTQNGVSIEKRGQRCSKLIPGYQRRRNGRRRPGDGHRRPGDRRRQHHRRRASQRRQSHQRQCKLWHRDHRRGDCRHLHRGQQDRHRRLRGAAVPNAINGVQIQAGATGVQVGGGTPGAGNLISGNADFGVEVGSSASTGIVVEGNEIGTDITGTVALGSQQEGVFDAGTADTIGGVTATACNVISGNTVDGIDDRGSGDTIEGNFIGTDVTGRIHSAISTISR